MIVLFDVNLNASKSASNVSPLKGTREQDNVKQVVFIGVNR